MKKKKIHKTSIWQFCLLAVLFYFLLSAFTALVGKETISSQFRSVYEPLTNLLLIHNDVQFQKNDRASDAAMFDTKIMVINKEMYEKAQQELRKKGGKSLDIDARLFTLNASRFAGLPTLIVLALILATPLPNFKKKAVALISGFVLVKIYILIKLWIWTTQNTLDYAQGSEGYQTFINSMKYLFVEEMTLRVLIPVSIWLFVIIKKVDWSIFKASFQRDSELSKG